MRLGKWLAEENWTLVQGLAETIITGVSDDSRKVEPGMLFIARSGVKDDGAKYLMEALARGARAVLLGEKAVLPEEVGQSAGAAVVRCKSEPDVAMVGRLAEKFYGEPSKQLQLVGITGTKGKTTVAYLIQQLLGELAGKCGMIGTICIDDGKKKIQAELTTPGAADFSRYLAAMVDHGCKFAVAEYSSHALHQGRVAALATKVGVFTNLTGDHLDYHRTMDAYADAKAVLFESLAEEGLAVVNVDDPYAARMLRNCRARVVGCTGRTHADSAWASWASKIQDWAKVKVLSMTPAGSRLQLKGPWGELTCQVPLVGAHNGMNVLQSAVVVHALCKPSCAQLQRALEQCVAPPGRLEVVRLETRLDESRPHPDTSKASTPTLPEGEGTQPTVLVDYAHTFDPLEKTLQALRPMLPAGGRLICMFGCGGDRDRTKRPKMAAVACREADLVIITSDNPRSENPQSIINEILQGVPDDTIIARLQGQPDPAKPLVPDPNTKVLVLMDRAQAIGWAIALAKPHDVVLLAGKGHETYQIVGTTKYPFDDREHARAALQHKRDPVSP